MTDIIPEEAFLIPLLLLFTAMVTPWVTVPIVFKAMNALLKKNKSKSGKTNTVAIAALFFPLFFLFMDKFQLSIFGSILICIISSIIVLVFHYLLKNEN
jgi:hypothetical protein